jgi:autotransporter-associated beta strand protein
VLAQREAGLQLRRQAVLFRTATHSAALEMELVRRGIPFVKYGGLRFQGNMSGAGRLIKRGPGHAGLTGVGKFLSGDIIVEQGVLGFSANGAANLTSTNLTVQPGGQVRLSTSQDSAAPRLHPFTATFYLAGEGRTGAPEGENLGVLGALRYEPIEITTVGTTALLTNAIHLTDSADIHVSGATNGLILSGPLTAQSSGTRLLKSGGGTLTLGTNSSAFGGGITVGRGVLSLSNAVMSATTNTLVLANETALTGAGRWAGALQASGGASLSFTLGSAPSGSAPLQVGSAVLSGSNNVVLNVANDTTPGTYPLLAVDGAFSGTSNIFLAAAPEDQAAVHDGHEVVDSVWIRPADALAEGIAGSKKLVFPTRMNLTKLARHESVAEAFAAARAKPVVTVLPELVGMTPEGRILRLPRAADYGGEEFLAGDPPSM